MNILITGASKGIGAQLAAQLAAQGHNVIAASRNITGLRRLTAEIDGNTPGAAIHTLPLDLTDHYSANSFSERIGTIVPHLDVLINNAGALLNKPFTEITHEELTHIYQVNVFGPFRLMQLMLPLLDAAPGKAHIVNISSMGGVQGSAKFPGLSAYSSSKAALANLSELLAEEFKSYNISVNCLALGAAQTEMLENAFPGYQAPLSAAEMAEYVGWFALNGHKYFNGKILPVALSTP
ncbi:MAG: SDR family oxidoreductase [Bacteroidetes bacterium]|nr:SDR family oxidoreductase [Bacteroidota bacterium]